MKFTRLMGAFILGTLCGAAHGENWPQWRGPYFNGSSGEKGLPTNWSRESALWSAELPGPSAATPIIWGDRVFISTIDSAAGSLHALCLDRKSGRILWNKTVGEGKISLDEMSNFASPSPVADGERCFFFFGNGTLLAYDHAGKELWSRSITGDYGEFAFNWTFSSSPTLYDGKLYLQVLQRNVPVRGRGRRDGPIESFLLLLDPATGKTLARVVRPTDAVLESHEAYTTPIPIEFQGRAEILIGGGDYVTGHDPETGREIWRSANLNPRKQGNWRLVPSPVFGAGIILACAPQRNPIWAIKLEGTGAQPQPVIAWKGDAHRELSADVPTPAFFDGDFFVLSDVRKALTRVEPATGNIKWTVELPGSRKFEAAPTAADGKIYLMNFAGDVVVADAAKGTVLSTVSMGGERDDMTRSAIAVAGGELFIRTDHKLYCIGNRAP